LFGIDELERLVPPPTSPWSAFDSEAWLDLFAAFGTRLPEDFVQFHKRYGEGFFSSRSHPRSSGISLYGSLRTHRRNDRTSFLYQVPRRLSELRLLKESRRRSLPSLYFERGGLLPWATATNGADLCWSVRGQLVDNWPVVVLLSSKGVHEAHELTALQFLAGVASGSVTCPLLPPHFPGRVGIAFTAIPAPPEGGAA
jgi:hypothetical protein